MKRMSAILLVLALVAGTGTAQPDATGGYSRMSVKAGLMEGNLNTRRLDKLSGGVAIELIADGGEQPNLPIQADVITFTWAEGSSVPAKINMRGNVDIDHPDAHVVSERADWNLETGDLIFTGNPVLDSADFKGVKASEIRVNLKTGAFSMVEGEADEMPLQGMENGGGGDENVPGLLVESDIADWPGLLNTIKEQAGREGDNPGKQVLKQLGEGPREMVLKTDTETLLGAKGPLLDQLNGVLRKPGMFKRSAWEGIPLSEEIETLLKIDNQTAEQQVRQNRLLLHAAYPDQVKGL